VNPILFFFLTNRGFDANIRECWAIINEIKEAGKEREQGRGDCAAGDGKRSLSSGT
jgi:hypothetical protein